MSDMAAARATLEAEAYRRLAAEHKRLGAHAVLTGDRDAARLHGATYDALKRLAGIVDTHERVYSRQPHSQVALRWYREAIDDGVTLTPDHPTERPTP